jgi:LCP family protein required for cell wall assembly
VKWLLAVGWAAFVVGGLGAGWTSLHNFARLAQGAPPERATIAGHISAPTPEPLAGRLGLRDFDQNPPPFAAAGENGAQPPPKPSSPAGRVTILLMGLDQRPDEVHPGGDPGRTDTMLLVSVDFDARTGMMVSIPRDGFVVIPEHGKERVNAAYTFGEIDKRGSGPALAKRTVAQLFGIPVDRYALVDIHSMEGIIDTLGGVWIDNPRRLVDREFPTDDYGMRTLDIPAGRQLMDGETAVGYARTRHPDSDFGRQLRQQQVLMAIRNQAFQLQTVPRLPQLIPQVLDMVRTDLSPVEITQLVNFGRGLEAAKDIISLPPNPELTPGYIGPGGASYINLTPMYRAAVRAMVLAPRAAPERAEIAVYNAGAPVGSGGLAADLLGRAGLVVGQISTAPRVSATRIEAGSAARLSAELAAGVLGIPTDALVLSGDSNAVRILLGPDVRLPAG